MPEQTTAWFVTTPKGRPITLTGSLFRPKAIQIFRKEIGPWKLAKEQGYTVREYRLVPVEGDGA